MMVTPGLEAISSWVKSAANAAKGVCHTPLPRARSAFGIGVLATINPRENCSDIWSLAKPRLSSLVVATAAAGMWLAQGSGGVLGAYQGHPQGAPLREFLSLVAIAMLVGASNATNCYLERSYDALMRRTAKRPLARGRLNPKAVLVSATIIAVASTIALAITANLITAVLGLFAHLVYVNAYTPLKRTSAWAVVVGAIPGAIPPLMGWTLVTGHLDYGGLTLFGIMFLWQIPHFIAIAFHRRDDYERAGFKTIALVVSDSTSKYLLVALTAALVPVSLVLVPLGLANQLYAIAAFILGFGFFFINMSGLRKGASATWARTSLHASLFYITLLFAAIALTS